MLGQILQGVKFMSKIILIALTLMVHLSVVAEITFEVVGPCSEEPILSTKVKNTTAINVGAFSVSELDKSKLEYIGTENKIDSINGTPVGEAALEILSRSEMRAYGWCYYVNGEEPDVYPNEVTMKGVNSVKWVFGYAHYLEGEWLSMCEPSWKIKPKFLCDK